MNVLDLFTRNGDRLTFLCNTHILVEGRRKTMKLGFIAQLIEFVFFFLSKNSNVFFLLRRL